MSKGHKRRTVEDNHVFVSELNRFILLQIEILCLFHERQNSAII